MYIGTRTTNWAGASWSRLPIFCSLWIVPVSWLDCVLGKTPSKQVSTGRSWGSISLGQLRDYCAGIGGPQYLVWNLCRISLPDSAGYTSRIASLYYPNSPSRTRTYNLAVNSRSLYQLSYRGIPMNRTGLTLCVPGTVFFRFFSVLSKFQQLCQEHLF